MKPQWAARSLTLAFAAAFIAGVSAQSRADQARPEKLNYSRATAENPQHPDFSPYWGDQLNSVGWTSKRPVIVFSRYFFNADGRRLFISMLSASGACGDRLCPVRIFTETGQNVMEASVCDQIETHEISADRLSLVACGTSSAIPQGGPPGSLEAREVRQYSHNGSVVETYFYKNGNIRIEYSELRQGLPASLRGTVLFKGAADPRGNLAGTAYTFKNGCDPAPYAVRGRIDRNGSIVLTGAAPMRDSYSCGVIGFSARSPHARLTFLEIPQGD